MGLFQTKPVATLIAESEATAVVVTAFQRHFRPDAVDGRADHSTVAALRALLAIRDGKVA